MTIQTARFFFGGLLAAALAATGWDARGAAAPSTNSTSKSTAKITELFGDQVVAKGKGVEIKRSEFDTACIAVKAAATARGARIPPEFMNTLERQVLNDLIGMRLILNKATAEDKAKGREDYDKAFAKYKADEQITDEEFSERLGPQLLAQGMTREQWQQQRIDQSVVKLVLERELKTNVTDDEVKKYYEEHPSDFEQPEMVRVSHILIGTRDTATNAELPEAKKQEKRKQIDEILKRARGGEDFAKLAREFSEAPGSKDDGGELRPFARGMLREAQALESTAFSLNTNQISDVITTQFGYHIIKLSEKIPAQKIELAKVTDELKEQLKQRAVQEQLKEYMPRIIQEANVEILDEKLKPRDAAPAPTPAEKEQPKKK